MSARVFGFFADAFAGQILPFESTCAAVYGEIRTNREAAGKPISVADAMIAATARAYGATLATRNLTDFEGSGVAVVNPWERS